MEKGAGRIPPPTREDGIRTTKSLESHSWLDRIVFRYRDPEIEERVIMYRVGGQRERQTGTKDRLKKYIQARLGGEQEHPHFSPEATPHRCGNSAPSKPAPRASS